MLLDDFYKTAVYGTPKEMQLSVMKLSRHTQSSEILRGKFLQMLAAAGDELSTHYLKDLDKAVKRQEKGLDIKKPLDFHALYKGAYCLQTAFTLAGKDTRFKRDVGIAFERMSNVIQNFEREVRRDLPNYAPPIVIRHTPNQS